MSAHKILLASSCVGMESSLSKALRKFDIELQLVHPDFLEVSDCIGSDAEESLVQWMSQQSPFNCLLLAPASASPSLSSATLGEVSDALTVNFAMTKAAISHFEQTSTAGRLVSLVPGDAAMGDPTSTIYSAIAGGMLSLFRTVALELRKTSMTANTIMYAPSKDPVSAQEEMIDAHGIAILINALLTVDSNGINGQEIYSLGGADVGRLHP